MEAQARRVSFSIPSILSFVAAILSFGTGALWGFVLAVAAIVLGVLGVLLALAPGIRGGFVSIMSIVLGVIGVAMALIKAIA
jgi:hypothetical protein